MTRRTSVLVVLGTALLALSQLSAVHGIPFLRGFRQKPQHRAEASHPSAAAGSSLLDTASLVSEVGPAGIAIAARQGLFDYSIGVAFMFLSQKLQGQRVPDVSKTFSIPVVGSFELQLSNIVVTNFSCSASTANLAILGDGFFHLVASDMSARLTFSWHWTKAGLSGSGDGELILEGGTIDWVYDVHKDEQLQKPQLQVVTANSNFDSVDLKIHSYSADWLYQAVLTLFNEAVKRQVQNGVASALDNDVPDRLNAVLGSLPTRLEVRGLPFTAAFEYSLYTAAFVLVKGFGEVEVPTAAVGTAAAAGAVKGAGAGGDVGATGGGVVSQEEEVAVAVQRRRHRHHRRLAEESSSSATSAATAVQAGSSGSDITGTVMGPVGQMTACPFETSPLPVDGGAIGSDPHMVTVFVHEATANCLLWGLYRSGKLAVSLRDGTIPGLTITTDVLALLVPELPTRYPHMRMTINVEALDTPRVSFTPSAGATLSAYYRLSLVVANESLGNPEVVRLAANLTASATLDWDTTVVGDVTVHHEVEASQLSVPAEQWDNTVVWLLQSYGGLTSLRQVVELLVRTPAASMVALANSQAATWDQWYGLSADVELRLPPPPARTDQGGAAAGGVSITAPVV